MTQGADFSSVQRGHSPAKAAAKSSARYGQAVRNRA
jgi:hypothetical protein